MDGLTEHRPIASLPFGGKYRLIDFPLSNLANAGIRSVFGIFQNENISSVFDHIRSGREWGLSTLLSHYYLGIYNTPVESSTVDEEYYRQILTYLKRSGSDQTVALNSDVLVNIDLNQVFHLHNTTGQKITVVYKKLPKELISDVNSILEIDESDRVLGHELFQGGDKEVYNMSTDIFVVDTPFLIEKLEEEAAKEFAKSYVEKNTPLLTVKVLRKQMPNFYMGLYAEGVNMVIFHEGGQTRRIELEQIFPKPDMEKMNKQHLPVLNPGVQLTVVYFLQELRKPNQKRDDAERMQHLRELEEEMLVNLMRSKFILAIDISQVQGEFDPANPGPDVRIPYIKNQNEDIFQPLFSDIGEFQKFRPDPQAKLRLAAIPFQHLLPYLMKQAKGFVINPSGFNLLLTREQLQRIMGAQAQSVRPNLEAMMAQAAAAQAQRNAQNNAANDEVKDHVDEAETTDAETDHEE